MSTFQSAPPAKADKSAESIGGHWYQHADGVWSPLYKEGGTFTLREARKLKEAGQAVVPSVTTLFKLLHKKQLVDWMKGNVARAAISMQRDPMMTDEEWIEYIINRADSAGMGAADLGSRIHKAIENMVAGEAWDTELSPYVEAVANERAARGIGDSAPEVCAGSLKYGYAGRVDDNVADRLLVIDYKSRKSKTKKVPSYDTDQMQLAAYGFALFGNRFFRDGAGQIYAISTTQPGNITVHEWAGRELIPAFEAFLGLCHVWRFVNDFDPRVVQP